MGIINCTPDSFSEGEQFANIQEAIDFGLRLVEEGADILDIGGESTRPGATAVSAEEELERVLPVMVGLKRQTDIPLSIDTQKASVAEKALAAGATIINDVSAGESDPQMLAVAAKTQATICLMHKKGTPQTMQQNPHYQDAVAEVYEYLQKRITAALQAGVAPEKIWIDPGFGFGKRLEDNVALLKNLNRFCSLGAPILVGTSRKSFIGELLGGAKVENRLEGSLATLAIAVQQGAQIVRVHDVAATRKFLNIIMQCLPL